MLNPAADFVLPLTGPSLVACLSAFHSCLLIMALYLKVTLLILGSLLLLVALAYAYYVYSPVPPKPSLSGAIQRDTLLLEGRTRSYLRYVPAHLPAGAPLVLVLHGSNINGATIRQWTGFEFDELADRYGFAVLYPDGYKGNWNDCRRDAPFPAKTENINDVGFMRALVAHCQQAYGIDPRQVYAFGYSNGGQLAFRLATEEPHLVAAIAVAGANLPTPTTCSCPLEGPTARVMLISGTQDPISPYTGGPVTLFGLRSRGTSLAARVSAEHFAQRNGVNMAPLAHTLPHQHRDDPTSVTSLTWILGGKPLVCLYTVQGGGHVVPQPRYQFSRLLGRTTGDLDAPTEAVRFFGLSAPNAQL
jgi:polyhydroxybutyrate depolymerase